MKSSHITILALIIIVVVGVMIYNSQQRRASPPPAPTQVPYTVNTPHGVIDIPGTAYIEAFDPATNSNIPAINVRSEARSAQPPACTLSDGDTVNVSDSRRADGAAWLYVTSGSCRGWVLSEFVTPDS